VEVLFVRYTYKVMNFLFGMVLFERFDFFDDSVHCGGGFVNLFLRRGHVAGQLFCY
jgi:hypothetical protein